jgi:hypothetical protein
MKIFALDTTRKKASIYIFDTEKNIDYSLELDEKIKPNLLQEPLFCPEHKMFMRGEP